MPFVSRKALTVAALLCTSSIVSGLSAVSQAYQLVLNGTTPLTQDILDSMYSQFLAEFRDKPSSGFLKQDNSYDRKPIFESKVRSMIAHNSNPENTWKKGINAYSDMTHEEFKAYYHILGDNQECSATYRPALNETEEDSSILKDMPTSWDWRNFNAVTPVKD